MWQNYLIAMSSILLLLMGWIVVQQISRLFAKKHPEFGPAREEGAGCGSNCGCHGRGSGRCKSEI